MNAKSPEDQQKRDDNLRRLANYLKKMPLCPACVIEGQEHTCQSIEARWVGREILRTLDRPGWQTKALGNSADKDGPHDDE